MHSNEYHTLIVAGAAAWSGGTLLEQRKVFCCCQMPCAIERLVWKGRPVVVELDQYASLSGAHGFLVVVKCTVGGISDERRFA